MDIISHRANGFGCYENSLQGFVEALKSNIRHIEIDLRLTKDNVYIANHDPSFRKRLLRRYFYKSDFRDLQFKFHSIKTYLDLFQETKNKVLHLDIKDQGREIELVKELEKRNLINRVVIISWVPKILINIKKYNPKLKTSFVFVPFIKFKNFKLPFLHHLRPLVYVDDLNVDTFDSKFSKGYSHAHFFSKLPDIDVDYINIPITFQTMKIVDEAKQKNIGVNLFTVNNKNSLNKFVKKGINAIYTNVPLTLIKF